MTLSPLPWGLVGAPAKRVPLPPPQPGTEQQETQQEINPAGNEISCPVLPAEKNDFTKGNSLLFTLRCSQARPQIAIGEGGALMQHLDMPTPRLG